MAKTENTAGRNTDAVQPSNMHPLQEAEAQEMQKLLATF